MRPPLHALLAASLALLLLPATARATSNFPPAIQAHLALSYTPDCSLCHVAGQTGNGTLTTPFGRSARERSLIADDVNILHGVLDRMAGERVDSDNDGTPDIEELVAGSDPNTAPGDDLGPLRYGCVGRIAPAPSPPAAWPLLCATLLAASLLRPLRPLRGILAAPSRWRERPDAAKAARAKRRLR